VPAHVISCSPVLEVERRSPGGGRWAPLADAANLDSADVAIARLARADDESATGTLRIRLAPWFIEEIVGRHGRWPVLLSFDVWAHLRPTARRFYAFAQGKSRSFRDPSKCAIYLADEVRFTLGLHGDRHEAAAAVRNALTVLNHADQRYAGGLRRLHPPQRSPRVRVAPGRSIPPHPYGARLEAPAAPPRRRPRTAEPDRALGAAGRPQRGRRRARPPPPPRGRRRAGNTRGPTGPPRDPRSAGRQPSRATTRRARPRARRTSRQCTRARRTRRSHARLAGPRGPVR
jgi:hypothetical protein